MRLIRSCNGAQGPARVQLIYIDAGGGHRASAAALRAVLAEVRPEWRVEMINLRDLLEPIDFIRRLTGVRVENLYNGLLKKNFTAGLGSLLKILHAVVRQMHPRMVPALADYWARERPDLVVSLIPHFNRSIQQVDAAHHDLLSLKAFEHLAIELRLRRLDGYLAAAAAGELRQE